MAKALKKGYVRVRVLAENGIEDGAGNGINQGGICDLPRGLAMVHLSTGTVEQVEQEEPAFETEGTITLEVDGPGAPPVHGSPREPAVDAAPPAPVADEPVIEPDQR